MKTQKFFYFKSFVFFLTLLIALVPTDATAQKKNKKKKKDAQEEVQKPKKDEKSIQELTKGSTKLEGLFTIYQDTVNGSIRMVIKE
ncbi:MAG: hypothetical protein KDD20_02750, partial [Mangrovimonas sp.]|nr:hypothetical protein [Mangrovimonas sp.]